MGPFNINESPTVRFYVHNIREGNYVYVYYYYGTNTNYVIRNRVKPGTIVNGVATIDYTLQFQNRLLDQGMHLSFQVTDTSSTANVLAKQDIYIYPFAQELSVSVSQLPQKELFLNQNTFHFLSDGTVINEERMNFKNTIDSLSNTSDNVLDISELSFTYNETIPNFSKAYLFIEDLHNIFPYISKDSDSYFKIPLSMSKVGEDIYFDYQGSFYYQPDSLEMSITPRGGFKQTQTFYLPVSIDESFESNDMYVFLEDFGYCKSDIKIPLRFYLEKQYLGLCDLSSFCIKGGLKG